MSYPCYDGYVSVVATDRATRKVEMEHYLYRLTPPRPTFPADMSSAEAAVMQRHFGYWQTLVNNGTALVFGPVADPAGAWGLAVIRAESEQDVHALAAADPAVVGGIGTYDVFHMPEAISTAATPAP